MNKKLFGTLLLGSLLLGGTFVSCKDYDDDIENLQGQITDVNALVAQLQSKLDGMTYVQNVTKSADGKTIKFTMSNGQTVEFTDTDTPGSVVTVEDGVLCIDGKPTEIKASSAINMPKVENGQIYIFNEETGKYAATGIFVNQNTVVESATKYTITMTTSDGTTVTYDVPKASGLITEIKTSAQPVKFNVAKYEVKSTMKDWPGVKPALKKDNIVFGFSTIDIRVNPVAVDLKGVEFKLVDTKNNELPSVTLLAKPEDGDAPITMDQIGTRANEGNGLWTLHSDNVVIEKSGDNTLDKKLDEKFAYAVTAGSARSAYCVGVNKMDDAPTLSEVYFDKGVYVKKATLEALGDDPIKEDNIGETTLDVNKAYTLVAKKVEEMALYDVYMTVSDLDKETYGIVIDNEARTVKYTKKPDVVTTDNSFNVNILTADNEGAVKRAQIKVTLSSLISTNASFQAQTYELAQLIDDNPYNNAFAVALDPMKNALGATEYNRWANNVDLAKSTVEYFTDASCKSSVKGQSATTSANVPTIAFVDANGKEANINTLKSVKFNVADATNSALNIGKQYYAKVTFKNKNEKVINSIVIPVKFTAPSVADQFKPKAGYVVDGVINAYFYTETDASTETEVAKKGVKLSRYFDAADEKATLTLKTDDKIVKIGNVDKNSSDLAIWENTATQHYVAEVLKLADRINPTDATEPGYGKVLTVNVEHKVYATTSWPYDDVADTKTSFQIKLMSPIFEGTIKPADGVSVKLVANSTAGSNITSEMIVATDYTGTNRIEIMPDKSVKDKPLALAWNNYQIDKVSVEPASGDTYVKSTDLKPVTIDKDGNITKIGYINVKANPVANDVDTKIKVMVKDAWGYTNEVMLPVTIKKQ